MARWTSDEDGSTTPSRHKFSLPSDDELLFKGGRFNLVFLLTLCHVLLVSFKTATLTSRDVFNPPVGGVAYGGEASMIHDNTLFGSEYDEERSKKDLFQ
ncbi:hypothetical protein C8F04DRAFT_1133585 [Mycena alexandri]|uniref:Transmembrane protein n=1 Tax=Mycena alexandri TaxID=1745969 RepID=A0AAD6SB94_9AGAR|nr:hypothetical protein C8F04DRAFT_1133585 [Mycena alexandri]